jgi:hypothetical protein
MDNFKFTLYSFQIFRKLEFYRQVSKKYSNIKFHENASSCSRVVPCGRTEERMEGRKGRQAGRQAGVTKQIATFRSFAKAAKKRFLPYHLAS